MFSFSCSFLVENATKTLRETLFLETNEETASKNRAEAETKLVYFNDGCAVKREIWVSPRRTRGERDRRHRCGVEPGGSGEKRSNHMKLTPHFQLQRSRLLVC